jgi:hypothetical protein
MLGKSNAKKKARLACVSLDLQYVSGPQEETISLMELSRSNSSINQSLQRRQDQILRTCCLLLTVLITVCDEGRASAK